MYRVLAEQGLVSERRNQREPRSFSVPRFEASQPNQVWTWDISKILTFERGVFLNLYVVLDLFSRCVFGWMLVVHENSALAKLPNNNFSRNPSLDMESLLKSSRSISTVVRQ